MLNVIILGVFLLTGAFSYCYADCCSAEIRIFLIVMLTIVMLSVLFWVLHFLIVILSVVMVCVFVLSVTFSYC
jgi:hypothetical protein